MKIGNHVVQLLVGRPFGLIRLNRQDVFGAHHLHHLRKRIAREVDAATLQLLNLRGDRLRRIELVGRGFVQAEELQLRRNRAQVGVIAKRDKRHVNGALVKLRRQRRNFRFRGDGVVIRGRARHLHNAVNDRLRFGRVLVAFLNARPLAHEEVQRGAVTSLVLFQTARVLQERHAAFGLRLQQQLRSVLADHFLHQLLNAEGKVHDLGAQHAELFALLGFSAPQVFVQPFHELRRHLVRRGIDHPAERRQERGHAPNVQLRGNELIRVFLQVFALQRQQAADFAVGHHVLVREQLDFFRNAGFFHVLDGAPRLHRLALQLISDARHVANAAHVFLAQQRVPHEGAHAPGLRLARLQRRDGGLNGHRQKRQRVKQQRLVQRLLERRQAFFLLLKKGLGRAVVLVLRSQGGVQRGHRPLHDEVAQRIQVHLQVVAHGGDHVGNHDRARVVVFLCHGRFCARCCYPVSAFCGFVQHAAEVAALLRGGFYLHDHVAAIFINDGVAFVADFALLSANGAHHGLVGRRRPSRCSRRGRRSRSRRHERRCQPAQEGRHQLDIGFHAVQPVRVLTEALVGPARVPLHKIQDVRAALHYVGLPQNDRLQTLVRRLQNVLEIVGAHLVPQLRVVVFRHARVFHVPQARQHGVVVLEFAVNALHGALPAVVHAGFEFRIHFVQQPLFHGVGGQVEVHARLLHGEALLLHVAEEGGVVHADPRGNVGVADPLLALAHVIQVPVGAVRVVQFNDRVLPVLNRALPQQHGLRLHARLAVVRHLQLALYFFFEKEDELLARHGLLLRVVLLEEFVIGAVKFAVKRNFHAVVVLQLVRIGQVLLGNRDVGALVGALLHRLALLELGGLLVEQRGEIKRREQLQVELGNRAHVEPGIVGHEHAVH